LGVALAWGGLMAFEWQDCRDPLTGGGLRGYIFYVGLHVLVAANATLTFCRGWRLLGWVPLALALFLAPNLPSKPGLDVRVANATATRARVSVVLMDSPARRILLPVPPGQAISYWTASGDYPETTRFVIECGAQRLPVTVADLRQHQVRLTTSDILLAKDRND
jgi:hypothetical protein